MSFYYQGDISDEIDLVTEETAYVGGYAQSTATKTKVFARQYSAYTDEYSAGQAETFRDRLNFDVFPEDYDGQSIVEHEGVRYTVARTFVNRKKRMIELHCERAG